MLYWLASFSDAISSQPIFRYVTFRAVGAMITALALMRLLGPAMLASLCRRRISGTRSAGAIMVAMLLAATLLWAKPINSYVWIAVGVVLAFGAGELVGECWSGRRSALLQDAWIAISATAASLACFAVASQTSTPPPFATPAGSIVDVGWLHVALGAFVIVAAGQIVKTADRAYGSVFGTLLIAAYALMLTAHLVGNSFFSQYLGLRYVPAAAELAVLCGAAIGAGIGFLWLNGRGTSTSIGDAASLALGGMLGTVAVATKSEIVLALICCLFVLKPARVRG